MTKFYRDKLNEIRKQNDVKTDLEKDLLMTDPNDTDYEIKKNLEANLGPIDTVPEIIAKGLNKNKKATLENEEENSSGFRP